MKDSRQYQASRITWIGFFVNLLLMILKLLAGIFGRSAAMVADAVHSISDFGTDLVVVGSLKIASRPQDGNHKYGHGKVETLAAALVGLILFVVGIAIFGSGLQNIIQHYGGNTLERPGLIAFVAALVSVVSKEILYHYTIRVGNRINSQLVLANAWHHRSDSLSSIGTVIGIGGALFLGENWVVLDPLAAMIVSFFIFKVSFRISRESFLELIETSLPGKNEQEILKIAGNVKGVHNPHDLKTRKIGQNIAIDLHIEVDKYLNVEEAHNITISIENGLRAVFGEETFISIHIEPLK